MNDREKIDELNCLIADMPDDCEDPGKYLFDNGVDLKQKGKWIYDSSYTGTLKSVFICSCCLHWQSIKKSKHEQINYMRYCPFCGAKMEV